jgi:hypothetical protein
MIAHDEAQIYQVFYNAKLPIGLSMPPSLTDIGSSINYSSNTEGYSAVFDPSGVWYYRRAIESDYQQYPELETAQKEKNVLVETLFGETKDFDEKFLSTFDNETLAGLISESEPSLEEALTREKEKITRKDLVAIIIGLLKTNTDENYPLTEEIFAEQSESRLKYDFLVRFNTENSDNYYNTLHDWIKNSKSGSIDDLLKVRIKKAYLRVGGLVRYVPNSEIAKEPACTGPDWGKD